MTKKKDNLHMDRLLAQEKRILGPEKKQILENVLNAVETTSSPKPMLVGFKWLIYGVPVSLGILTVVLWGLLGTSTNPSSTPKDEAFTPKGGDGRPLLAVACGTDGTTNCHREDSLAFQLRPPKGINHVAIFAQNKKTGTIIWYYPKTENEHSLNIEHKDTTNNWLHSGVLIGDEHSPGIHEVTAVYSASPMTRGNVRAIFEQNLPSHKSYVTSSVTFKLEKK